MVRAGLASTGKIGSFSFAVHALLLLSTHLSPYRLLHVHNTDTPLLVGVLAKLFLGRRVLITLHGDVVQAQAESALGRARLWLMSRSIDIVVALSEHLVDQAAGAGVDRNRLRLIPNGVDTHRYEPCTPLGRREARRALGLGEDDQVILFVGRLHALKQVDLLLEAWSNLPRSEDLRLLLVGDGPEREALEHRARRAGLEGVRFEGEREGVSSYLHACDVFVLPSREEGISVALLEAMATGCCVVASDVPGNRAVVKQGRNGLLVSPRDDKQLAATLQRALNDARLRRRLGAAARATAESAFELDDMVRAYHGVYRELNAKRTRREQV